MNFMEACVEYQKAILAKCDARRALHQARSTEQVMDDRFREACRKVDAAQEAMNKAIEEMCSA